MPRDPALLVSALDHPQLATPVTQWTCAISTRIETVGCQAHACSKISNISAGILCFGGGGRRESGLGFVGVATGSKLDNSSISYFGLPYLCTCTYVYSSAFEIFYFILNIAFTMVPPH